MDHDSSLREQGRMSVGLSEVVGGRNARDMRGSPTMIWLAGAGEVLQV